MVELRRAGILDIVRFVASSLVLTFSIVVTSYAIVTQKTLFWDSVPGWAALILFIIDLFFLALVEGLQIALVELKRQHPDSYKSSHPSAYLLGQVASIGDNVERFLMGRQVCVVFLVFFAAKLTTIAYDEGETFLFPTPNWVKSAFFETGFLACVVVVIVAQLMPQIAAAKYPVHFLEFYIMRPTYYVCILIEMTGLTHACWLLSGLLQRMFSMDDDATTLNPNDLKTPEDIFMHVTNSMDGVNPGSTADNDDDDDESKDDGIVMKGNDSFLSENDPAILNSIAIASASKNNFNCYTKMVDKLNQTITPDTLHLVRNYLDRHPEKFSQFPSIVGDKMYPAPGAMASQIRKDGHEVPAFLTDISDPNHVPPHIVVCELLAQNRLLKEEVDLLGRKLKAQ